MKVNVRGKNKYVPTLDVKERAEKKLQKMDQYFRNADELQADVVCKAYESYEVVEVTIPTKNIILRAEVKAESVLAAIDLANTEALKTIVNGIFESKFLEGNEGRIIRIILKLAKVLDIPLHSDLYNELVSIDYNGEQEILTSFIDALAPVLQDEEFSIVNEEGKMHNSKYSKNLNVPEKERTKQSKELLKIEKEMIYIIVQN